VPDEVRQLWQCCQVIKKERTNRTSGHPRGESHDYPFSRVLKCHRCGNPYHGEAVYYKNHAYLRLIHKRRTLGKQCDIMPKERLRKALENLRKQHLWGDISDIDYRRERADLERQIQALTTHTIPVHFVYKSTERPGCYSKRFPSRFCVYRC
jgi:hypothetical protein